MFGGFAGAFFATRQAFISPESFTFIESAIILAIVVLGGLGSQIGVAIAALVMIGGFELFRGLDEWRMLVFGGAMVVIMVLRPRGLVGTRTPSIALGGEARHRRRPGGRRAADERPPAMPMRAMILEVAGPDHALRRADRRRRASLRRRSAARSPR